MDRREFLKKMFATGALTAGGLYLPEEFLKSTTYISIPSGFSGYGYASASNQIAILKEFYTDDLWIMNDMIYKTNPFLKMALD